MLVPRSGPEFGMVRVSSVLSAENVSIFDRLVELIGQVLVSAFESEI